MLLVMKSKVSFFFTLGLFLLMCGSCSRHANEMSQAQLETKLNAVLQQMMSDSTNSQDRDAFKGAELFKNIPGLPMEIAGFSLPINAGKNHAHLSFTLEHFRKTSVKDLAKESDEHFQTAKLNSKRSSQN
jgi:hypothetical protein